MLAPPLSIHEPLWRASRLGSGWSVGPGSAARDAAVCLVAGVTAAVCVHALDFNLKIPGHAILRSIVPITLGLSLAPRRLSGTCIGLTALATSLVIRSGGLASVGWGAFTSLLVIGPLLDAALWHARSGGGIILRCAAAGLLANLCACAIKGGNKLVGLEPPKLRTFSDWLSVAPLTYVACGLAAGFVCGALWFRFTSEEERTEWGDAA